MATYILLLNLTPEGRARMLEDPETLRRAEDAIEVPGISVMGVYGVLGEHDFVSIVEAPDNGRRGALLARARRARGGARDDAAGDPDHTLHGHERSRTTGARHRGDARDPGAAAAPSRRRR